VKVKSEQVCKRHIAELHKRPKEMIDHKQLKMPSPYVKQGKSKNKTHSSKHVEIRILSHQPKDKLNLAKYTPPLNQVKDPSNLLLPNTFRRWRRKWRKNPVFLKYLKAHYRSYLPSQLHPCTHMLSLSCLIAFEVNHYSIFGFVLVAGYAAKNVPRERSKWLRLIGKAVPNLDLINVFSVTNVLMLAPRKP
jgi:hypothetical protein